jgi:UDP:flavonoid glycosyltransferase YjiC (YdhE family)
MRVLYAVCGWGLGHATRSLPVLRRLAREHDVLLYADGPAAALLESELAASARVTSIPAVPYPNIFAGRALALRFFAGVPRLVQAMRREHAEVCALVRAARVDRVVSDSRWGASSPDVPSYFISHHLKQIAPPRFRCAERLTEAVTWAAIHGRFRRIFVPDVEEAAGLSGRLAHDLRWFRAAELRYVGPLSDVTPQPVAHDVDTLVVLGGPEPARTRLERRLLPAIARLRGRTVVLRGMPGRDDVPWPLSHVDARPHATKPERDRLFSAARVVVGRSGYTTVMDVAQVGARAVFIPMPGQTEQEYLADRLARLGRTCAVAERDVDVERDVAAAAARPGLRGFVAPTTDAARRIVDEVLG